MFTCILWCGNKFHRISDLMHGASLKQYASALGCSGVTVCYGSAICHMCLLSVWQILIERSNQQRLWTAAFSCLSGKSMLPKIPALQSHCSSALSTCRISECTIAAAQLMKLSHLQADMTVHLQKSWINLQNLLTENSILVKKTPCHGKTWTFVIPRYKRRFAVRSLPSREGEVPSYFA